jgi:transcriptional regulator with XRE-family HTH domain
VLPVFGELLQKARLKAGMTQEELAAAVRLTREYISLLEHDKRTPTIHVFIRLARALRISPATLIEKVEKSTAKRN